MNQTGAKRAPQDAMSITLEQETVERNRTLAAISSTAESLDGADLSVCAEYVALLCRRELPAVKSDAELRFFVKECAEKLYDDDASMLNVVYNLLDAVARARAIRTAQKRGGLIRSENSVSANR